MLEFNQVMSSNNIYNIPEKKIKKYKTRNNAITDTMYNLCIDLIANKIKSVKSGNNLVKYARVPYI